MQALKRVNKSWYDNIVNKAKEGKDAFLTWWDASVPGWVKALFGNVAAAAIWDFISTFLL